MTQATKRTQKNILSFYRLACWGRYLSRIHTLYIYAYTFYICIYIKVCYTYAFREFSVEIFINVIINYTNELCEKKRKGGA